nr:integrase, catalytic region, zinc finger, CCHC-type, peptidase aspartic, catalytic [Tanacetum cinerariifolium]
RIEDHFASECRKPKENKAFIGGAWIDSEDGDEYQNNATCLMAIDSQEVCLKYDLRPDDWFVDSGYTKHIIENKRLFTSYKACDGEHVVFGSNLKGKVIGGGNITRDFNIITNVEHVCLKCDLLPDNWIVDSGCTKQMARNKRLFTLYKAYDGGHVVFGSNLKGKVIGGVSFTKVDRTISKNGKTLAKGHRRNGLYTCKLGDNSKQQISLASMVDNSILTHRRIENNRKELYANIQTTQVVKEALNRSKSSYDGCWVAKSRITCVNTNGNTMLSEAHGVSLRITFGVRVRTDHLPLEWRAKVMTIEEDKDLATLPLDELISNHKVYEMILKNDGVASKTTKEKVKSLALKAKVTREQTSDDRDNQG